jgi:hypothetical protein
LPDLCRRAPLASVSFASALHEGKLDRQLVTGIAVNKNDPAASWANSRL